MRITRLIALPLAATLAACATEPVGELPPGTEGPISQAPLNTQPTPGLPRTDTLPPAVCPAPVTRTILVDASHDGGVWWYPQVAPFDAARPHQGRALADTLRARGYVVHELGRGTEVTADSLLPWAVVIRAGQYGPYLSGELAAYQAFAACPRTLLLMGEFLRDGQHDVLAEDLGIPLTGWVNGIVTDFTTHAITSGAAPFPYIAGSVLASGYDPAITVLGRLSTGEPVMGVVERSGRAKIFFLGDLNGLELVPQPLVANLIAWF